MRKPIFLLVCLSLLWMVNAWAQDDAAEPTPEASPAPPPVEKIQPPAEKVALVSPLDNGPVEGWRIEAFSTLGVDSDFCYLNASESYYQKLIATDPRTGYTGYPDDFLPNLKQPLPLKVVEKIKKKIPKMFDLKKLEPWDRYEILARIYIWRGMPEKDIGNAYLRATYTMRGLYYGEAERERERDLRKQAIKYLDRALEKAQFPLSESSQVKYLIGDLYRRNGKFGAAISNFEDAAKMKNKPEWLDEMIIRQKARAYAYDES
jgi:tetratricopeptide (TPR) repeat protein